MVKTESQINRQVAIFNSARYYVSCTGKCYGGDLDRSQAPDYTINNFSGYFNVKTPFLDGDEITTDNGNLGKFSIDSLHSDPNYRPQKYKNWIRFKNVDASETDGLEHGMWGYLVLDLTKGNEFQGKYIFQAGYHIGGTLTLACRVQDPQ